MFGQRLNFLLTIVSAFMLSACGRPSKDAPRFLDGQNLTKGDGSELSVDRRSTRTWKDYDGDGLSDRKDFDIDDDGVSNLADQFPFDGKRWGDDKDGDGIADFIDFTFTLDQNISELQEELKKDFNIIIINGSASFSTEQIENIYNVLRSPSILSHLKYKNLRTIIRYSKNDQIGETRAEFDESWMSIGIYPDEINDRDITSFTGSFVHELGHVHASENKSAFEMFAANFHEWSSPSSYGLTSVQEGYAEEFLYQIYKQGLILINPSRFDLIDITQ